MEETLHTQIREKIDEQMKINIIPWLKTFIEIPNTSQNFDPEWETNGLLQQAAQCCIDYAKHLGFDDLKLTLTNEKGKPPLLFGVIEGTKTENSKNIMFYGHLDKQPHLTEGWREGLHPFKAVEENGLLYGRGGVDDGYNFFTVLSIIRVLKDLNIPHDRYILFYECDEESTSADIPFYLDMFKEQIGNPEIMFCLDSASISTKLFCMTTTLRGCLNADLRVRILKKGVHSGMGSGIVPSTFRIARQLIERVENNLTGKVIDDLQVKIPEDKVIQTKLAASLMDESIFGAFPFVEGAKPITDSVEEAYTNSIWTCQLEVIGQEGIPVVSNCGNVLRDETVLRLSFRLPPTLTSEEAYKRLKPILEANPPYGAHVTFEKKNEGNGWNSNEIPADVLSIFNKHNDIVFGSPTA